MASGSPTANIDDLHGMYIDDLTTGMTGVFGKTITEADVTLFAGISGDTNPIHLNHEFATASRFKGPVAHGMLTAGLISAVIATRLPGPGAVYLSQILRFTAPVRVGETVCARATITDIDRAKQRVRLATVCQVGETVVIDGEALIWVPARN